MIEPQQIPGFVLHIGPGEQLLQAGAELVNEVSISTGFPDPAQWPDNSLIEHTRKRQRMAYQTVIATLDNQSQGQSHDFVVGHALLLPVRPESWKDFPEVQEFVERGTLAELGATAVHPKFQRQGLAKAMRDIRCLEARRRELVLCVSVWDGGNSHLMYKDSPEWTYLGSSTAIYSKGLLHKYIESSALVEVPVAID